jgi:hypothetical protein
MPKNTDFPGIQIDYPDLGDVPVANEMSVTAAGKDYNITIQQVLSAAVEIGLSAATAAALAAQLDDYITGSGGGGPGTVLDEDDFVSNSPTLPPSQQSTKVYVDTGLATKAGSSHDHVATAISDSTAAGRALLTATDVAAQKAIINQTGAEIITALESAAALSYTALDDLDSSGAGEKYEAALMASSAAADGSFLKRNGTEIEGEALGTAARLNAIPSGAPTAASSSAGTIALDFTAGVSTYGTATTENITTINVTLTAYQWGQWIVTQTTARDLTFPAATVIFGNGGLLAYTGVANSRLNVLFYKNNTELWAIIGDAGVVGA